MRLIRTSILAMTAALSLTACNIDEGNRPVKLELFSSSTGDTESATLYQCSEGGLAAVVTFLNGSAINFLDGTFGVRPVELSSSDESVVAVSDGTMPVPGREGFVYPRGTLVPIAPGNARITANYSLLTDAIDVTVQGPDSISIAPDVQTVAVGSAQNFTATVVQDGRSVDATSSVRWRLLDNMGEPVDGEIGVIGSANGVVVALAEGGPFTVEAQFSACFEPDQLPPTVDPEDLRADVNFQFVDSLELSREFAATDEGTGDPVAAPPLLQNTSEAYTLIGHFADPADGTQNLSQQSATRFTVFEPGLEEDEITDKAGFGLLGVRNILSALQATDDGIPLQVSATFGGGEAAEEGDPEPPPEVTSNTLNVEIVEGTLQAVVISPEDVIVDASARQQFNAAGTYLLADEVTEQTQDITRHVSWRSSDTTVAAISSQVANAGLSQVVTDEPGCTFITAVPVADDELEVRTRLFANDNTVECVEPDDGEDDSEG